MTETTPRNAEEPIRLFESDFLEFFTHINPIVVLAIWLPVVVFFLWRAVTLRPAGTWLFIPIAVLSGLLVWTLAEYVLHRFVFHFHPKNPTKRMERILFLFHGIHHAQPRSKTRLVMPPVVSIPLASLFYGLFYVVFAVFLSAAQVVAPLFAGFIIGYIAYDMLHYSMHHFSWKGKFFRMIRRHHMAHHFKTPNLRFGVSSPLWDIIIGTNPAE